MRKNYTNKKIVHSELQKKKEIHHEASKTNFLCQYDLINLAFAFERTLVPVAQTWSGDAGRHAARLRDHGSAESAQLASTAPTSPPPRSPPRGT